MNNRQYPVHLSIASSTEIEQTARQLKATREEFLITGIPAQRSTRPMILESWRRCSAMQVSPLLRNAPLAIIHEDQLRCLLEGIQLFLRAAHPAMKRFSDFLDAQVLWNLLETELLDLERLEKMELFAVSPEGK